MSIDRSPARGVGGGSLLPVRSVMVDARNRMRNCRFVKLCPSLQEP